MTDTAQDVTQQGSTVGSVNGNVSLTAGNELTVKGSNLVAGRDMALSGKYPGGGKPEQPDAFGGTEKQRTDAGAVRRGGQRD